MSFLDEVSTLCERLGVDKIWKVVIDAGASFLVIFIYVQTTTYVQTKMPDDELTSCITFVQYIPHIGTKHCVENLESIVVIGILFFLGVEIFEYFIKRLYDKIKKDFFTTSIFVLA